MIFVCGKLFYPAASEPGAYGKLGKRGLTYVAEGSITEQEYMDKLEHFVRVRTRQVEASNYQYNLRQFFDAAAVNYRKPERASRQGGKKSS